MSITQTPPNQSTGGSFACPSCQAPLPPNATFCSSCGERIDKQKLISSLLQDEADISTRYRITSLVRRRPYVNLYFAFDNHKSSSSGQQRMVAIRDIDISSLEGETRVSAMELAQHEYDLLRRWQLPHVMPVTDLRYFQGHLFVVTGKLSANQETVDGTESAEKQEHISSRLYTLQDFLQSGQGLPSEQSTLKWTEDLCLALDRLHSHQIVVGDLDPYTIILNEDSQEAEPALMISWLPPGLRTLLPPPTSPTTHMSYFGAPEALLGKAEPRSDIYSLGAILYLLLTGTPPSESALRTQQHLRSPRELNARISMNVDECVMQALSVDPADRFPNIMAMARALHDPRFRRLQPEKQVKQNNEPEHANGEESQDVETVRIVPLSHKNLARWQASRPQTIPHRPLSPRPTQYQEHTGAPEAVQGQPVASQQSLIAPPPTPNEVTIVEAAPALHGAIETPEAPEAISLPDQGASSTPVAHRTDTDRQQSSVFPENQVSQPVPSRPLETHQRPDTWRQRITGIFPPITPQRKNVERGGKPSAAGGFDTMLQSTEEKSWFRQLQRFLLGQPQQVTTSAAIIETPLRVQPNQEYTIRMHVMGRDEPVLPPDAKRGTQPAGLSALVHGDKVLIEVRSALYQSYAYIVQRALVAVPADGYVAEVTIPMRPLASGPTGRRDRLHIFFLNEQRQPLYDKPFVVELFISHLVQPGREGHNVLTLPI
ncbi:MAG TPA: zinc-ribbon domain-containing protein [Ktedonobacteraceae bacterium]